MKNPFFEYFEREKFSRVHMCIEPPPFKEYARFSRVSLPTAEALQVPLDEAFAARRSADAFLPRPVPLSALATLLKKAAGTLGGVETSDGTPRRPHPSGGAKFPLEIYVSSTTDGELKQGLYHYNIREHALEQFPGTVEPEEARGLLNANEGITHAPLFLFFSFLRCRSVPKYGDFAYKLGLIEAGHIGQNVYLAAATLGIGCRALGGGDFDALNELFFLDGMNETIFYTLALGFPKDEPRPKPSITKHQFR